MSEEEKRVIISVWNSIASLFHEITKNDTLTYEKIDIPSEIMEKVQEYIESLVDVKENRIYPLNEENLDTLIRMGVDL